MSHLSAINTILQPLASYYDDETTVEMRINRPGFVVLDRRGIGKREIEAPEFTVATIEDICKSLANFTNASAFHPDTAPKLSCVIPGVKHRFECLVGNSVQSKISLAIRCKHPFTPTWEQVGVNEALLDFLKWSVHSAMNMVVSGATNTGKTTFINKLLTFLPDHQRVIGAEDTPELELDRFWDGNGFLCARDEKNANGLISWGDMYDHFMRITPDNVIFGEISIQNAFAALAILNSGATGFTCSLHAHSPKQALSRKFDQNVSWSGRSMPKIDEFLHELVDLVVQIKRGNDGLRKITDIYAPRLNEWVMASGQINEMIMHKIMNIKEAA